MYFNKNGQRHFHLKKNTLFRPVVNIDKLWSLVTDETREKYSKSKDKAAVIDVTKAGYFKVLICTIRFLEKVDYPINQ
jgi:large subunit ribosomal protein L27Ae